MQSTHCAAGNTGNQTVCNGTGCCQASIPEKLQQLVSVTIDDNTTTGCKVALLTDDPFVFEDISDPEQLHAKGYATVELGWGQLVSIIKETILAYLQRLGQLL
ncbi:Wall-associated receptor kinase-like 10 [Raphanus sativus]|nr:Wall-associated receptor kinase-like 10 [Raphanus sativus]